MFVILVLFASAIVIYFQLKKNRIPGWECSNMRGIYNANELGKSFGNIFYIE